MNTVPQAAEIIRRTQESDNIFTLRLRLKDANAQDTYQFKPGQFNMLYLYGVGEVPISIDSDPDDNHFIGHTIRAVGRVTKAMQELQVGDTIGFRGPFGRGWPLEYAQGKDLLIATGGLGCAPVVAVINYVARRRDQYGRIVIMQGVKHSKDLLWRDCYDRWAKLPDTEVVLAADVADKGWPYATGRITTLLDRVHYTPENTVSLMCGPEIMMILTAEELSRRGVPESEIFLSMERNMKCAAGQCGHCQFGKDFVCKDGPVFQYHAIKDRLHIKGI